MSAFTYSACRWIHRINEWITAAALEPCLFPVNFRHQDKTLKIDSAWLDGVTPHRNGVTRNPWCCHKLLEVLIWI